MPPKLKPRKDLTSHKPNSPDAKQQLPAAINSLGLDLLKTMKVAHDKNIFVSPFSTAMALGMVLPGAAEDTAAALANVLHLDYDEAMEATVVAGYTELLERFQSTPAGKPEPSVRVANCIWANTSDEVVPEFSAVATENFKARVLAADFEGGAAEEIVAEINRWVSKATNRNIKNLLDDKAVDPLTRMVLVNAIHFKAKFESKFKAEDSKARTFYGVTKSGKERQVPCTMMHQKSKLPYHETKTLQYVELPYVGSKMSLRLVVPKDEGKIHTVMKKLDSQTLTKFHTDAKVTEVSLHLPQFRGCGIGSLKQLLTAMGMGICFDEDAANFSRLFKEEKVHISDVLHQTFIAVDEKGTEAAAATTVLQAKACKVSSEIKTVWVGHPSLVILTDHTTGIDLFMGILMDPSPQKK